MFCIIYEYEHSGAHYKAMKRPGNIKSYECFASYVYEYEHSGAQCIRL